MASSAFIKENNLFKKFTGWQDGYAAFTYSYKDKDNLIAYIKTQEEHHRNISFKEELSVLLEEHGVARFHLGLIGKLPARIRTFLLRFQTVPPKTIRLFD